MSRANNEEIYIPYGVGICGHVAKTKETINLKDAYEVLQITLIFMICSLYDTLKFFYLKNDEWSIELLFRYLL